jgi:hypothetical protein
VQPTIGRASVLTITIALLLCASGCDRFFVVKPEGQLGEAITFSFYEGRSDNRPSEHNIIAFFVQEQKSQGVWSSTWELSGAQSLDSITYGSKYERLKESAAAVPLLIGKHYRVIAEDEPRFSFPRTPPGVAENFFVVDEHGRVIVERPRW